MKPTLDAGDIVKLPGRGEEYEVVALDGAHGLVLLKGTDPGHPHEFWSPARDLTPVRHRERPERSPTIET